MQRLNIEPTNGRVSLGCVPKCLRFVAGEPIKEITFILTDKKQVTHSTTIDAVIRPDQHQRNIIEYVFDEPPNDAQRYIEILWIHNDWGEPVEIPLTVEVF